MAFPERIQIGIDDLQLERPTIDPENPTLSGSLSLARYILNSPHALAYLGSGFSRVDNKLFNRDIRYAADLSACGPIITPRNLDLRTKGRIEQKAALGVVTYANTQVRRGGFDEDIQLTRYQDAILKTKEGDVKVRPQHGEFSAGRITGRQRYKPPVQLGYDVNPDLEDSDEVYILSSTTPSEDGRGAPRTRAEITFSPTEILDYRYAYRKHSAGEGDVYRQEAVRILTKYVLEMNDSLAEQIKPLTSN